MKPYLMTFVFVLGLVSLSFGQRPKKSNLASSRINAKVETNVTSPKTVKKAQKEMASFKALETVKVEAEAMANLDGQISKRERAIIKSYEDRLNHMKTEKTEDW